MNPYNPVSCDLHSQYELLIMHHDRITVHYRDPVNQSQHISGLAHDLYTRNGEEFIVIQPDRDAALHIRLDRIIEYSKEPQDQ